MEDFLKDLTVTLVGVVAAKVLDLTVEALKAKTSRKRGKHSKKS